MRTIIFDTEATDLVPGQLCQLAAIIVTDGKAEGLNLYFSVDQMEQGAQDVHGLSMEMLEELSDGAYFEDHAQQLFQLFQGADLIVGHNVQADENYLRVEMERCGLKLKRMNAFCTMNFATGIMNMQRKVVTGRPKPPKLEELCQFYGVDEDQITQACDKLFQGGSQLHDARYDTAATYLCLLRAIEQGDLRGMEGIAAP